MLELLEKYPQAASVIRSFYLEKMLGSLNDASLPDNFKEYVRAQDIDNEKIAKIAEASPKTLFDVFDANDLVVETMYMEKMFHFTIVSGTEIVYSNKEPFSTRLECDKKAVEIAMGLLNSELCKQIQS
jgi:hypothetical protein